MPCQRGVLRGCWQAALQYLLRALRINEGRIDDDGDAAAAAAAGASGGGGGESRTGVAAALNDLAQLHQALQRPQQALPLMQRALAIYEEAHGSQHPDTAAALNNLGNLHQASHPVSN